MFGISNRLGQLGGAALLLLWSMLPASAEDFLVDFCGHCSSAQDFLERAEHAAPNFAPGDGSVRFYDVFVVRPGIQEIRFYQVQVWYDWGGAQPDYLPENPESVAELLLHARLTQSALQKLAVEGVPDPAVALAIGNAMDLAEDFVLTTTITGVDSSLLPHVPDSALDLLGPENSPAGLARAQLRGALNDYINDNWRAWGVAAGSLAGRLMNQYAGQSDIFNSWFITVRFPDGTEVTFEVTQASQGWNSITIMGDVLQNTAKLPDGRFAPWLGEQFPGFDYEGGMDLGQSLWDLAGRLGARPYCSFRCDQEDGDPYPTCTLNCRLP